MTCDDACTDILREIGGDPGEGDSRAHVSGCPTCADYRREAERVWRRLDRAVEPCPPRRNVFDPGRRRRAPSAVAAAAAALIAAASLVAWAAWPAGSGTPARQDPDEELRRQVHRVALQEKERLAEFEKKLAEAERGLAEARALLDAGKVRDAAARAEDLLGDFPKVRLAVMDSSAVDHRASLARLRLREIALTGQIQLLKEKPEPEDGAAVQARAEVEIRLYNRLRETRRQQEALKAEGPRPKKDPVVEVGGAEPTLHGETLEKLRSIKVTLSFQNAPMETTIKYLREITGLNMVVMAAGDVLVNLELQDATCEAALEYLTKLAGAKWDVDRFGIIVITSAKK